MTSTTVVLGADPAGLTVAYDLTQHEESAVTVLEPSGNVGGLARTERYQGYQIDLGSGESYSQAPVVRQFWQTLLGAESVEVEVRSLIHYRHRLFKYPLTATNALKHLGPIDTALTGLSYFKNWLTAQHTPDATAQTTEEWVTQKFGSHLSSLFFEPYFEKVWGLPSHQLAPSVASHALTRPSGEANTLIRAAIDTAIASPTHTVSYPKTGAGQAWEQCKALIEQGGSKVALNTQIIKLEHTNERVTQVIATEGENIQTIPVDHLVSSLPLATLVAHLNAPAPVQEATQCLRYRHIIQVALIVDIATLFDEQSIYVNHPNVLVSRIQNFKNWSSAMVENPDKTCLGLTYFCDDTDALWQMDDAQLIQLASQELMELGLIESEHLIEAETVIRQPQAYPIHTTHTMQSRAIVKNYLAGFQNLQTVGAQGLHRAVQLDSDILDGQRAAENILNRSSSQHGYSQHDLWETPSRPLAATTPATF